LIVYIVLFLGMINQATLIILFCDWSPFSVICNGHSLLMSSPCGMFCGSWNFWMAFWMMAVCTCVGE